MNRIKSILVVMLIAVLAASIPSETGVSFAKGKPVPSKVHGLRLVKTTESSVSIKWKKAKRARKYIVYRSKGRKGRFVKRGVTRKTRFTDYRVRSGTVYRYCIRGYNGKKGKRSRILIVKTKKKSNGHILKQWDIGGNGNNEYDYGKQAWSTVKAVLYSDGLFEIVGKGNIANFTKGSPWFVDKNPKTGEAYNRQIKRVYISKSVMPTNMAFMFKDCKALVDAPSIPKTAKQLDECFAGCSSLKKAATIDTGNVIESAKGMYKGCESLSGDMWILGAIEDRAAMTDFFLDAAVDPGAELNLRCRISEDDDITGVGNTINGMLDSKSKESKIIEKPHFVKESPVLASWKIGGNGSTAYNHETQGDSNVIATLHKDGLLRIEGTGNTAKMTNSSPWKESTFEGTPCKDLIKYVYVDTEIGTTNMGGWFGSCGQIKCINRIPKTANNINYTFHACKKVKTFPVIPEGVKSMQGVFYSCEAMEKAPAIPKGVGNLTVAFTCCYKLKEAPDIPNSVENAWSAFSACYELRKAADIPEDNKLKDIRKMYDGCKELTGDMYVRGPLADDTKVDGFFERVATQSGANLKVKYSFLAGDAVKATVDKLIATKSPDSNIEAVGY